MASFFSTLFGGGAERDAANRNRAALQNYNTTSLAALDNGLNRATGAVTGARDAASGYLAGNMPLYEDLRRAGGSILDNGRADSIAALERAGGAYDPVAGLGAKYGAGTDLYLDSLGVNGADGNTRAVNAFQAGPGYEFTLDQGLEALNRRRVKGGMLASGNADLDAIRYGTGLANQTYGGWQDRLAGFINPELSATTTAATGRAGVGTNIANLIGADTAARLGLETGVTQGQAGVNSALAGNEIALGNSLGNLYTGDAQNRVGVAGNVTSGNISANNLQAQGEANGARNVMNGVMGLASLAAGMGGSFMGGGGMPSSAGHSFSTMFGNGTGYQTNPWSSRGMFGAGGAGWGN